MLVHNSLSDAGWEVVVEDPADAAVAALETQGTVAERLDSHLQRAFADGYEALSSTAFGAELMEARHEVRGRGLRRFVGSLPTGHASTRLQVVDLLTLSPAGLMSDHPLPVDYRRGLSTIARAAARLLESD